MECGKKVKEAKDAFIKQKEEEYVRKRLHEMVEKYKKSSPDSGVPCRFADKGFADYKVFSEKDRKNLNSIIEFSEKRENDGTLLLMGPAGSGKTHLGCAVLHGKKGWYCKNKDINAEFAGALDFRSEVKTAGLIRHFKTVPMLIVDEIGYSGNEKFECLKSILMDRYDGKLPTVLITCLEKKDIVQKLGNSVFRRLKETCFSVTLEDSFRHEK